MAAAGFEFVPIPGTAAPGSVLARSGRAREAVSGALLPETCSTGDTGAGGGAFLCWRRGHGAPVLALRVRRAPWAAQQVRDEEAVGVLRRAAAEDTQAAVSAVEGHWLCDWGAMRVQVVPQSCIAYAVEGGISDGGSVRGCCCGCCVASAAASHALWQLSGVVIPVPDSDDPEGRSAWLLLGAWQRERYAPLGTCTLQVRGSLAACLPLPARHALPAALLSFHCRWLPACSCCFAPPPARSAHHAACPLP